MLGVLEFFGYSLLCVVHRYCTCTMYVVKYQRRFTVAYVCCRWWCDLYLAHPGDSDVQAYYYYWRGL
jgi:hypothetical protein